MLSPLLAHVTAKPKPALRAINAAGHKAVWPIDADCADGRHVTSGWWVWAGRWSCRPLRPCGLCGAAA